MPLYRVGAIWYYDLPNAKGQDPPRLRKSTGTAEKKAAQRVHDRVQEQLWRQEQLGEIPPMSWGDAIEIWSETPRSLPDRYTINGLDLELDTPMPLTEDDLRGALKGLAPGTFNRYLTVIRSVHKAAKREPPKIERQTTPAGRIRWLTAEEWKRLRGKLEKESPLLRQCADFAVATGLRENNVLNLRWDQVDMRRRVAWWHADEMKGRQPHGAPLNDDAMAVLAERRGENKTWVFANPDTGEPLYKASNRSWYQALRSAKLVGFRWHDLRHTWASWHVMSGTRLEELQRLGGWKTLSMVQRYAHLATEHLAGVAGNVKPVSLRYSKPRKGAK